MSSVVFLFGAAFLFAVLCSGVITWCVREFALQNGWAVQPVSNHHIHELPIPRLGGVSIFFTFMSFCGIQIFLTQVAGVNTGFSLLPIIAIFVPAAFLFAIGLIDDLQDMRPGVKLFCQIIASIMLYWGGFRGLDFHRSWGGLDWGAAVSFVATMLWVIGISNAMNIIDGIDGLACGSALFTIVTIFVFALAGHNLHVAFAAIVLGGAILGFLRFNFNPATIFLGDCGSLFIGFLLSSLALASRAKAPTVITVAVPVVALALPIMETMLSIARRFLGGRPIFGADREHIHHKLLDMGWSQRQTVALLYAVCGLCALLSLFLLYPARPVVGLVLVVLSTMIFVGVQKLAYPEFAEIARLARRTLEQKKVIENNVVIRRAAKALLRVSNLEAIQESLAAVCDDANLEGYELIIKTMTHHTSLPLGDVAKHIRWHRAAASREEWLPQWRVTVPLGTAEHGEMGSLTVFGRVGEGSILFDVNVLIEQLRKSLSTAIVPIAFVSSARARATSIRPLHRAERALESKQDV